MTAPQAKTHIKHAWIVGVVTAAMTLFASLLPLFGVSLVGFNLWTLTDFVLIAGLTFGISRKSRTCALIMLVYFVVSKSMFVAATGDIASAALGAIFAYFFFQGVRGAFAWHRLAKAPVAQPPELKPGERARGGSGEAPSL
jgi:hypothetical protein